MALDIGGITERGAHEAGVWVDTHGVRIKVRGPESTAVGAFETSRQRDVLGRRQRARLRNESEDVLSLYTGEEFDSLATERAVVVTLDWEGITREGVAVPFSADAARTVYEQFPSVRQEVLAAASEAGKFWPLPSTNSANTSEASSV